MQNTLLLCIFLYHCILYFQNVAFWAFVFLFQRFVESTFFCRMYEYIIFVIMIILQLFLFTFPHLLLIYIYFLYISKCCSFSSKVQVKFQIFVLFLFLLFLFCFGFNLSVYVSEDKQYACNIARLQSSRSRLFLTICF